MRFIRTLVALVAFPAFAAGAQDPSPYPVSVGLGGGFGGSDANIHGLLLVSITPPRSPVSLRLDGVFSQPGRYANTELFAALSASAAITLRPWRVSPYLLVGVTRTLEYTMRSPLSGALFYQPPRTDLTGGLGLKTQWGRTKLFGEMRHLPHTGTLASFGVSF